MLRRMARDRAPGLDQGPPGGRREPVIGDVAGLDLRASRRPPVAATMRPRPGWWLAAAVVLAAVVALVALREPLAERLWPQTRVQRLLGEADAALARGHLTAADGSGARELYEAALAVDPDRGESRAGLARVAEAALQRAREAADAQRFDDAHQALGLARTLSAPREQTEAVAAQLRGREASHAGLDALVARAAQAAAAGRLEGGDDAALPLYARVLSLQPDRADALRGREDALSALLEQARAQLRGGDIPAAAAAIATVRRYDAGHVDLPDTQARFTEELDAVRRRAEADLARGRLEPAVAAWRALLRYDAGDEASRRGLQRAADVHAHRAERLAADYRFAEADAALAQARALSPEAAVVLAAQSKVDRIRRDHAQRQAVQAGGPTTQRVARLLQQASAAEARGDLLTPPGDSAYDKLRAAQALAPRDRQVQAAVSRLLPSARMCFDQSLGANNLGRAADCLEARSLLGDDEPTVAQARRRLAQRWLAIGDERLAGGQLAPAQSALAAARATDPATPGIAEFDQRLRRASLSVD